MQIQGHPEVLHAQADGGNAGDTVHEGAVGREDLSDHRRAPGTQLGPKPQSQQSNDKSDVPEKSNLHIFARTRTQNLEYGLWVPPVRSLEKKCGTNSGALDSQYKNGGFWYTLFRRSFCYPGDRYYMEHRIRWGTAFGFWGGARDRPGV